MELYGNQISAVLEKLGISYSQLAKKLGVTQPNVSVKMKRNTWSCEDLQKMCDVLNIRYDIKFYYKDGTRFDESVIKKEPDYSDANISRRISFIMETLFVTQTELAERLDMSQSSLSRRFANNSWKIKDIGKACRALGIGYTVEYTYKNGDAIFDYSENI